MNDELKKAFLWAYIGSLFAGAWSFNNYLDYKTANTQEQTKRVKSLDSKCVDLAKLGMTCNDTKGGYNAK